MMRNFPQQNEVIEALLQGIQNAQKNFLFWSNNRLSLSSGPQKIISIHVAQELSLMKNPPEVFIDATVADILRCSLLNRNAFRAYMQEHALAQGTFSITLDERMVHHHNNDSISRVIISVHNGMRTTKPEYMHDIERICKMLQRAHQEDSTLDYGVFAFYADISALARKRLDQRLKELMTHFATIVARFPSLRAHLVATPIYKSIDSGEWMAGCYIIKPSLKDLVK